jgi:redox-sensing transcriptional repressor
MTTIGRLGRYIEVLDKLPADKRIISSHELASLMGVTPSTVRQDFFSHLDNKGKSRVGYDVKELRSKLVRQMGLNHETQIVVIGSGRLAQTLAAYREFARINISFKAFFDRDEGKVGQAIDGIPVHHIDTLGTYLQSNPQVRLALLAVPEAVAQKVAEYARQCGIEAIWNYSPVLLNLGPDVLVQSEYMGENLYKLIYALNNRKERGGRTMELLICVGSSCHLKGSEVVIKTFQSLIEKEAVGKKVILKGSFCMGKCSENGVTIKLNDQFYKTRFEDAESFFYEHVMPAVRA